MSEGPNSSKWLVPTALLLLLYLGLIDILFVALFIQGHAGLNFHDLGDWFIAASAILIHLWAAHQIGLMRFPWLLGGMLAGLIVGIFFTPAEARIGLPINYAVRPITGAAAGAFIGVIMERRRAGKRPENQISD